MTSPSANPANVSWIVTNVPFRSIGKDSTINIKLSIL